MKQFYVKDCPSDSTIFSWISKETNLSQAILDVTPSIDFDDIVVLPHALDLEKIIKITKETLDQFGIKGWQTSAGESRAYGGLSLVYNPDLIESVDPNQNTLGTKNNAPNKFYYGSTEKFQSIKNTYFDSYGFRKLAPCVTNTELNNFISQFVLSPTRSRIGVINARYHDYVGEDFLWHKDEIIFENLRINIPIITDDSFLFQLESKSPLHLHLGKIYTWDTHRAHRVYSTYKSNVRRVHLVLGFSPWINYDNSNDCFIVNDYFGKVHPLDILLNGLAHPLIGNKYV
jgi:hypothetical protein